MLFSVNLHCKFLTFTLMIPDGMFCISEQHYPWEGNDLRLLFWEEGIRPVDWLDGDDRQTSPDPISWCQSEPDLSCLMTKPTKSHVPTVKTQISLGICPVWSEPSLSAWRKLGFLATPWVHSEDSGQTGWMPRLILVFARRICHFVGFVMRWLISLSICPSKHHT